MLFSLIFVFGFTFLAYALSAHFTQNTSLADKSRATYICTLSTFAFLNLCNTIRFIRNVKNINA